MIEFIRCPTCANSIGEYYVAFIEMKKIYIKNNVNKINNNLNNIEEINNNIIENSCYTSNISYKEILDLLMLKNYCCRTHMISASNFFEIH